MGPASHMSSRDMDDDEEPQDDEEFARRLQQQEDLLAGGVGSGATYGESREPEGQSVSLKRPLRGSFRCLPCTRVLADFEETLHNAPDIDDLQYEDLQHVSEVVGTVSRGLAAETLAKLPRQTYNKDLTGSVDSDR